jgi:putative transposase
MPVHVFRTEHSAADLRRLARQETGRVCQRLLLIANLLDGVEREAAARVVGLGRQAAYDWHNRYEEEGVAGLRDRRRAGRPRRTPAAVEQALVDRIGEGPVFERDGIVAFRGTDARRLLREEHGLTLSLSAVYRLLHRNRLSWLVPRPRHPRSEAPAQEEFRQLSAYNFSESPWRGHAASESRCGSATRRGSDRRTR